MLGGEEGAGEVGVDRRLPNRPVQPVGAVVAPGELDGRVGDDDVEAVERGRGPADRRFDRRLVGDVGRQRHDVEAGAGKRRHRFGERVAVDVDQPDTRPLLAEALGGRPADPPRGAGDERALALEAPHRGLP